MDSSSIQIYHLLVTIFILHASYAFCHRDNVYNMVTYTPVASGHVDTTQTLLKAWNLACDSKTGGTVTVPQGTFLVNTVVFKGPCNGPMIFNVNGILKAPSESSVGERNWISFSDVDGLTISGEGTFDGQGPFAWPLCKKGSCPIRPDTLKFNNVKNAVIQGIRSVNSKFFHYHIYGCENINISSIIISAPVDSPNTDGIHISYSDNIQVSNAQIATGDDCISIGPGSTNLNISSIACGPGHGISIGSLGKSQGEPPVRGVLISDSTLTRTTNGLRIKSFAPSPRGTVSDITYQNIIMNDVENPILIDQHYCPHDSCAHKGGDSQVRISNVRFINVKGTSSSEVSVNFDCSQSAPCQEIVLQDLQLTYKTHDQPTTAVGMRPTTATCSNFYGTFYRKQVPSKCSNNAPKQNEQNGW